LGGKTKDEMKNYLPKIFRPKSGGLVVDNPHLLFHLGVALRINEEAEKEQRLEIKKNKVRHQVKFQSISN
jgi:hypothetical protein